MPELTSQERLQPSLLDRLTDNEPRQQRESVEARALTRGQLRAAVLRDLSFLLNAVRLAPAFEDEGSPEAVLWRENPDARRSVINFGLPALSGRILTVLNFGDIEGLVREAIVMFEPRLDPATVEVELSDQTASGVGQLRLIIRARLWSQPVPIELLLSAELDVETGQAAVRDLRR